MVIKKGVIRLELRECTWGFDMKITSLDKIDKTKVTMGGRKGRLEANSHIKE
jgi:hypothetical protein